MTAREQIRNHKGIVLVGMLIFSILVNGCFFPIVNFNPKNTTDLVTILRFMIIAMTFTFHKSIASLEAVIFPKAPIIFIGAFNVFLVICGLICRYLLESGEVSNVYNFTILNIAFHVIILALISTAACLLERKKK